MPILVLLLGITVAAIGIGIVVRPHIVPWLQDMDFLEKPTDNENDE